MADVFVLTTGPTAAGFTHGVLRVTAGEPLRPGDTVVFRGGCAYHARLSDWKKVRGYLLASRVVRFDDARQGGDLWLMRTIQDGVPVRI